MVLKNSFKLYAIISATLACMICLTFTSCNSTGDRNKTGSAPADSAATDTAVIEWKDDPVIGKVQPGYYRRVGIVKNGETYEEMLELQKIESRGYLIVNDDGTAVFELDGEKTEYVYDEFNLYPAEDTTGAGGTPYVFIGGRLVVNDGAMITQYVKLSAEELAAHLENGGNPD